MLRFSSVVARCASVIAISSEIQSNVRVPHVAPTASGAAGTSGKQLELAALLIIYGRVLGRRLEAGLLPLEPAGAIVYLSAECAADDPRPSRMILADCLDVAGDRISKILLQIRRSLDNRMRSNAARGHEDARELGLEEVEQLRPLPLRRLRGLNR